jgi:plasmid replication initiation protein
MENAIQSETLELVPANTPETLGVTPRYVLQHNAISRSIHNLSATAKKLTAMAMAMLPADLSSLTSTFTFTEFCKAIGYEKGGESYRIFTLAVDECMKSVITVEMPNAAKGKRKWEKFTWFTYAKYDEESGKATMTFSAELASVLLELKRLYAKINLLDVGQLQSKYAIRLFEMAKSYESLAGKEGNQSETWYFERTLKELRENLGVEPQAYKETRDLRKYVVEKPVKEINNAGIGLEIQSEGIKQGRNLVAIRLNCKKTPRKTPVKRRRTGKQETSQPELSDLFPRDKQTREEKENEHLKELYPDEFSKLYAEALKNLKPIGGGIGESFRMSAAEANALAALRERHGIVK